MISCHFEHGAISSLRHVTADVVLVNDQDEVLLTRRASNLEHIPEGGKLAIPGGFVDRDEFVVDGARREVMEETGYTCGELTLLRITSDPKRKGEDRQNVTFIFFGYAIEQVQAHDHETEDMHWYSLDALPSADEIAFDHLESILTWKQHREGTLAIPVIN